MNASADVLTGQCLCGGVHWEVDGPLPDIWHCHCTYCRKSHGSAFATIAAVEPARVRFIKGEDLLGRYRTSPLIERSFCTVCGSTCPFPEGDQIAVPVGSIVPAPAAHVAGHLFAAGGSCCYEITDDLPQYDALPGGNNDVPPLERPVSGLFSGSCLCDAVAFRVNAAAIGMMNCHCDRCKRSRAAAHATNVFVSAKDFEWIRGEDNVKQYKVPEAERFASAFCTRCGGLVPRVARGVDRINIPAGCLDNDPGIRPRAHIWVSRKVPWLNLSDGRQQFEERFSE
ncbi:MAG: GFA family protein [Pseudomonadales bacterium]|nr:GFA family protein [Pseudomonadales bacterium]